MSQMQCKNGHVYDAAKFPRCPMCVSESASAPADYETCERGHRYDRAASRNCPYCPVPGWKNLPPTAIHNAGGGAGREGGKQQAADGPQSEQVRGAGSKRTEIAWERKEGQPHIDPVVGWLVAIDGPTKGRDYRLFAEGNQIGQAAWNAVSIDDPSIALQDSHATVIFDPKSEDCDYWLKPGDRHVVHLIRFSTLKREAVMSPVKIAAYDQIEIGRTTLLFIPLCDKSKWSWGFSFNPSKTPTG